ncbi:phospholipase D-like domain-containing protein [Prevotella melaninogenica]|jgi:putative phosphatidylserine/phosphatidylglycerophosphate/ cardioli pin synthase|uniref:phospholipase D-like domain-containing protein n=1 Tax=Prevotella melaninogenica TaxID=28132 RepID=UPI003C779F08
MKLSEYTIQQLVPFITGNDYPPTRSGRELVALFNTFGFRDVYKEGLPINPKTGQNLSRKQYVEDRLLKLLGNNNLRLLLEQIINESVDKAKVSNSIHEQIREDGFSVAENNGKYIIQGGVIDRRPPVQNEAHFKDIQNKILTALNNARVSIRVVMAWFTNNVLFEKLVEKSNQGIDVQLLIYDDGVNKKYGVDFSQLTYTLIQRANRGGLMHDKFCVIDNQIVITGSYNWTNNAEFKNDENITIEHDPAQATKYSEEYRRLAINK